MTTSDLTRLFNPKSIVVVGASEKSGSIGNWVVKNLLEHSDFDGALYLVNPKKNVIDGITALPDVASLPEPVDVAIVAVPASHVIAALQECGTKNVSFALVLTSGFAETGDTGIADQQKISDIAQRTGMRVIGPNCPGLCNIADNIGMTFSPSFRNDRSVGPIGLATHGGGLGRNMLQAGARGAGVSLWASLGNAADLDVPDVIEYFAHDPRIAVIATLLEGIADGPALIRAARIAAAADKPVVALKVGRSEYGARAVQSHTAAIAGSAVVNSAVLRQLGVIEVDDTDELMDVGWLLSRAQPAPSTRVAIWGASGGALSLCADHVGQAGLTLAQLQEDTVQRLSAILPSFASTANPVDITAAAIADSSIEQKSLEILAEDPGVDVILAPLALDYGERTAGTSLSLAAVQKLVTVPIVPIWMSDVHGKGYDILAEAGFCSPRGLSKGVLAVARWAEYGRWRDGQSTSPTPAPFAVQPARDELDLPRSVATEPEAKAWLAEHGVTVPRGFTVHDDKGVHTAMSGLRAPVVAKVVSTDLAHKTDVGGVVVGLQDAESACRARQDILAAVAAKAPGASVRGILIEEMMTGDSVEMIVGVHRDPVFGHLITVGAGGVFVELLNDTARHLLPLDRSTALKLIESLRMYPILAGMRGGATYDIDALADLLVSVSDCVSAHRSSIEEVDLNPVIVRPAGSSGPGSVALDALVVTTTMSKSPA
ncbi:acetate--CoA ligase family protein [Rhodococcoides fascians]|uniref:acetate--CoA ligase family protein n=1 Tax=Rhodococcoides fascians TaxID=1828 RepID=UPI0024BA9E50|nr:acetate--CoA ligase family protein [Rhodococcus fascians]MDJ0408961.1 acetate--CoA ligase family protein [Rhodococcus fascians]